MPKINKEFFNKKKIIVEKLNKRSVHFYSGKIATGKQVEDLLSGLKGSSITRCVYLNGCVQHEVQPSIDEDGKIQKAVWIDENQLIADKMGLSLNRSEHAKLGFKATDSITGLKGITIAYAEHSGGLEEYEIQPFVDKDGQPQQTVWMELSRLEFKEEYSSDDDSSPPDVSLSSGSGGGHRNHP